MNDAHFKDSFQDLFITQVLEDLWGGHRDSLLFALLQRAGIRIFDDRLEDLAAALQNLVAREVVAEGVSSLPFPLHLHSVCGPSVLSESGSVEAQNLNAAHVFILPAQETWGEALQNRTGFLKDTHQLWVEGGDDVVFLVFFPRAALSSDQILPFAQRVLKLTPQQVDVPSHRRLKIEAEGLYFCESLFVSKAPQTVLFRVRQLWPAFPLVVRGLVFETQSQRVTPYSSVAKDGWSYHLHPYSDRVPVSMERQGDLYRLAFCARLSAGAELFMDTTPEWSLAFQTLPTPQAVRGIEVWDMSCHLVGV